MQNIISVNKKTTIFDQIKALWAIVENLRKTDKLDTKHVMHYLHYNTSTENLEATDGRRAMTVHFPMKDYGIEAEAFFVFDKAGFLSAVDNAGYFPAIERVMPDIKVATEHRSYVHAVDIKALDLNDKYALADYEICSILGSKGVKVNGLYIRDLKDILNCFDVLTWPENAGKSVLNGPVYFYNEEKTLRFVVMPICSDKWAESSYLLKDGHKNEAAA